jgi:hypothetical protein
VKTTIGASVRPPELGCVIGLLALLVGGCGYHFGAEGSGLPRNAQTIYVETFNNRTRYTGINDEFMRYLKDEIDSRKRLTVVDNAAGADLVLSGTVLYNNSIPANVNAVDEPIEYYQSLAVNATLTDGHSHAVIWTTPGLSSAALTGVVSSAVITTSPYFLQQNLRSQDIAKLPDMQTAQTQNAASQTQMMEDLAQTLYASMSEGF